MSLFFDKEGKIIEHHNLQDKAYWCEDGKSNEESFIGRYGKLINYQINPMKVEDPYVPDLMNVNTNNLADLKIQHSPFFRAKDFYGIDPTFAVVFNLKDRIRYEKYYPDIEIVYFVEWIAVKAIINNKTYLVYPLHGIFRTQFFLLNQTLQNSALHNYRQRTNDQQGNAKSSYVLDLRNKIFERLL